jgi:dienelactone hydrolase
MENQLIVQKTARYFTLGDPKAKNLLYVLHGYGQLAFYFLKKFEVLAAQDFYIVAPEGMHRFYLSGTSGRVGASWMTRESRETDISDNIRYLNELHASVTNGTTYGSVQLLGFSQGGATAARWKNDGRVVFDRFVLWASVFPDDVPLDAGNPEFGRSDNYFLLGDEDPYYTPENRAKILDFYARAGFNNQLYKGTHAVDPDLLPALFDPNT